MKQKMKFFLDRLISFCEINFLKDYECFKKTDDIDVGIFIFLAFLTL